LFRRLKLALSCSAEGKEGSDVFRREHIEIKCPANNGFKILQLETILSILLQILVDADCKLIVLDIGVVGRRSDGEDLRSS
jgi:uncharacterized protein related to proFAR isomerase